LADAYTDLIQGAVLIGCLLVLGALVVMDSGGPSQALSLLQQASQGGEAAQSASWLEVLDSWAVPVLGSLFAQELASRVVASRSATLAKRATLVAAGVYLCLGLIPVCLGAIARTTLPGENPEAVLAALSQRHLGAVGYVVFAGALVSAILSTVDSALLVSGSLVSHNLAPVFRPDLDERARLRLARISVCGLGLVAYLLAHDGESVHNLVMEASAFGSAGICISGSLGLFTRIGGTRSAYGALVGGALAWVLAAYVFSTSAAFIASLAAALLGYAAGAFQRQPEAEACLHRRS
jgi:Na+/proline symporter